MVERYKPKEKPPVKAASKHQKPLVRVDYVPDRIAELIQEGPDQSEIRWKHNGNYAIATNNHIKRIEP